MNEISKNIQPDEDRKGKDLKSILSRHLTIELPDSVQHPGSEPPKKSSSLKLLLFLKPIPYLLILLFIFSFFWDFPNLQFSLFGYVFPLNGLLRIISVSGMIGFLTNWIAITMLFRPLNRRPLLGQGLIPAQKDRIAWRLSTAVAEDLINPKLIKLKIEESKIIQTYREQIQNSLVSSVGKETFREDFKEWIVDYVHSVVHDDSFRERVSFYLSKEIEAGLKEKPIERTALKTYTLLKGQTLQRLIEESVVDLPITVERNFGFVDEFFDELPERLDEVSEELDRIITDLIYKLVNRLDIQKFVQENLRNYDEQRLEQMIKNATNEQLKIIQYLGAVLGLIGGFVIWEPVLSLTFLTLFGVTVVLTDRVLYQ
ncbi:DUF445 domain-containing protein [Rhodohalobacter halophilus]|uniref:DUF445 domain-containing protein n=1 Tax=Rhodohalobacter halophilus TaxID=1812810 RepID=UPI00083F9D67|nr:DUF445 family protein [Rhodohalobacter halophilus]